VRKAFPSAPEHFRSPPGKNLQIFKALVSSSRLIYERNNSFMDEVLKEGYSRVNF
jgi:hypothetical protein